MVKKLYAAGGYTLGGGELLGLGAPTADDSAARRTDVWGINVEKTSADETNATQTPSAIASMAIAIPGAGKYDFEYAIPYQVSVTGNGIWVDLNGPTNSFLSYVIEIQSNTTTNRSDYRTALNTNASLSSTGAAGTTFMVRIAGRIIATASGTLQPRYSNNNATAMTTTIKTGAYGSARLVG